MAEFKLTRKAAADLEGLLDFSRERFGVTGALQLLGELEQRIHALARHDFDGPELRVASRELAVKGLLSLRRPPPAAPTSRYEIQLDA